ncbi:unnamed protein product [Meloidogyne enterolobii]|uniref:Uncharacterized protein n=1 Tax=Meloidogyne enterolobii TaxID=390850 RepID=A0ACB1AGY5_MELEN
MFNKDFFRKSQIVISASDIKSVTIAPVGVQALGQRFNTYNERKNRIGPGNNVPMLRNRASALILILEGLISTMKKINEAEYQGIKNKDLNALRTEVITFMAAQWFTSNFKNDWEFEGELAFKADF